MCERIRGVRDWRKPIPTKAAGFVPINYLKISSTDIRPSDRSPFPTKEVVMIALRNTKKDIGLAPMEGVTELPVRLWFALVGSADFTWTPFLRVTDTFPARIPVHFAPELNILKEVVPFPVIPQLMGSRVEDFVRAAEMLLTEAPFVDLNCGCPSPTVVGSRAGSSLLERVDFFAGFVSEAVRRLGPSKVSVKMRTGFHDSSEIFSLIESIRNLPLAQLTVHGRTRPQRYTGFSDWALMDRAIMDLAIPVVGSGDICDFRTFTERNLESANRFILGRGALRNPWVFQEIKAEANGTVPTLAPILPAMIAFGLLQDLGLKSMDLVLDWALAGGAAQPAGVDGDQWHKAIATLRRMRGDSAMTSTDIEVTPRAFARIKMLWNYLRSSLPEGFMEPSLLRTKSLAEMLSSIKTVAIREGLKGDLWPLRYRPECDWMYSGQGRGGS